MTRIRLTCLLLMSALCLFVVLPAQAVYEKKDGFPWNLTLHGEHDKPIADALPNGSFFMNVGPTGIRAQITHKHPAWFTVKFVFPKSPAYGKIKAGDVIIGGNGHVMDVPHKFGRRRVTGWDGPMVEMSKIIEYSQGKDGKLDLIVWPGGNRSQQKTVTLQIDAVGKFADSFPYNCKRSDKLMKQLCDWLANEYTRTGKFGRIHTHTASTLALMASGDNRYTQIIEKIMSRYPGKTYSSMNGGGFQCWTFGLDGIVMGEYYLLSKGKAKALLPAFKSLAIAMHESQDPQNGAYSHKPYPFIMNRVAQGGPRGYGAMSGVAGLIFIAESLMKTAGLETYPKAAHERLHQGYLHSWSDKGYIGYGMNSWDHAVIQPVGESVGKARNKKGIGYEIPTGMEGIDKFRVTWPTADDKRGASTEWLGSKSERAKARVFLLGKNKYLVVRDMTQRGPQSPTSKTGQRIGHIFRSGCAALGHAIGGKDNKPWLYMADHYATACAASPNALLDGHASTLMHTLWGSLGAARAHPKAFRYYMQGIKWWFIMAQTHDGSFVPMPGRDYASTDHVYAGRNFPTATAALILSVKERKLQITGADSPYAAPKKKDGEQVVKKTPKAGADLSALGAGFSVVHCKKEAKLFDSTAPYATVLRSLDSAASRDDDRAKEAVLFAQKVRAWLNERNGALLVEVLTHPAKTLAHSRMHIRRLAGIDTYGATELRALIDVLSDNRDIRRLSLYYDELDKINALSADAKLIARRKEKLKEQLERFIAKGDLDARTLREAKQLLAQATPQPDAETDKAGAQ